MWINHQIIPIFDVYRLTGQFRVTDTHIEFRVLISNGCRDAVYKQWSRKKFGVFDPNDMPEIDDRISAIKTKLEKLGEDRLKLRMAILSRELL
jgi:hypothetical protein